MDGIMVRRFNAKESIVTYGGFAITGFAEDMITASKDEDFIETSVGAQGDVVVNEVNNPLGTISMTIQATSPAKKVLLDAAKNRLIAPLWVENPTIGDKMGGTYAQIKNYPELSHAATAQDLTIEFAVFDYDVVPEEVQDLVVSTIGA